jgi:hypothetical protein
MLTPLCRSRRRRHVIQDSDINTTMKQVAQWILCVERTRIPVSILHTRKTCRVLQRVHTHPDSYSVGACNKQPERESIHLHLSSAKAKNEWRCNFITPYAFMTCEDAALLATVRSYVRVPTRTACVWLLKCCLCCVSVWEHVQYADSWNLSRFNVVCFTMLQNQRRLPCAGSTPFVFEPFLSIRDVCTIRHLFIFSCLSVFYEKSGTSPFVCCNFEITGNVNF